ncbi:arylsulfatase [Stieleria sp. TO1_6]|uniref:arylsulfatase n=1 Tax=Stieleria tagensis TaxID=2956795 RepID=UPI00209B4025|nr:arylsulfatase [Stieleria tagensis]MCO8121651.1 arylsulfatase [Stieleria tagensis]
MNARTLINAAVLAALAFAGIAQAKSLVGTRPNIILVMTDDQGMGDLSCLGNPILKTPNLDRFYDSSTRFTDFHVSPTCAPTRSALLSGRAPLKNGVTHTILQRERMTLDVFTVPEMLKSAGYTTGIFGKWHLGDEQAYLPGSRGFDEVLIHGAGGIGQVGLDDFPPNAVNPYFDNVLLHNDTIVQTKGFCTDLFFRSGLAWIKQQHSSNVPYFAYLSCNAPHGPYHAPEKNKQRFLDAGYDQKTAARYGMIENIDENFGLMMEKLRQWKALQNTIVIFMTDNGMSMPMIHQNGKPQPPFNAGMKGKKNSPDEGGSRVPAFWYWQGILGEGVDVDALTAHLDLYKTFSELAGATLPETMQELDGRSLLPLLSDPDAEWPDRELFFHCGRWATGKAQQAKFEKCAVRTQRWRFVNNEQLYDITQDPGQAQDVFESHPDVVQRLRASYDRWWASAIPLMVNEDLPRVTRENQPLAIRYRRQLDEQGIPDWTPDEIETAPGSHNEK